jgi:hypothetical protein
MKDKDMSEENNNSFVGCTFKVDFGDSVFHTTFNSDHTLSFKPVKGNLGVVETVSYKKVEIHSNAYLFFWQEIDKTTVTAYWDFKKLIVYSNVTLPDSVFLNLSGTLTPINPFA